ncbi:MAG: ABC transporter permease [Prevotella sp.]|nr:ABC transporter permease [Prevotella sp.]
MKKTGLLHTMLEGLQDTCYIWHQELRQVFKDEGVLIFCILVPLVYPLLYSWIYNNETVHEVPVVVVDNSHSYMSRDFIRRCDAAPDIKIAYYASDMDEAKTLVSRQLAQAIYFVPSDFQTRLNRMEQSTVSVYCDMSMMLAYKAAYQTAMLVSQEMNSEIQIKLSGHYTKREEQIQAKPLESEGLGIFNPSGGYGSGVLPAVLMLILQQTLVLGIGLAAGTARESHRFQDLVPIQKHFHGTFRIVFGKSLCYFMIYMLMGTWLTVIVPRIFHFPCLAHWDDLLAMMIPYTLACIFFGLTVSCLVRYRENVMLLVVFVSIPLLFLSGATWPQSSISGPWQGVSMLFPSTYGIRAYIRMNSMGGTLGDTLTEYRSLWMQVFFYFLVACLVYRHQIHLSRRHALGR